MLDINFIRNNLSLVKKSTKEKGYNVDFDAFLKLDDDRKNLLKQVEKLRQERNLIATKMKNGKPEPELIKQGKELKAQLTDLESELDKIEQKFYTDLKSIPNIILEDVPLGGEEDSIEVKHWGKNKTEGVDHLDYAISRDWVDFERGAKVAGAKFYYLKNISILIKNGSTALF